MMFFGGLYDPNLEIVRTISNPTLSPPTIFGYLFGAEGKHWLAAVDNLEDVVGGHILIALLLIGGGLFHIRTQPYDWTQRLFVWSGEVYLSYSLGALALMGFIATYFVSLTLPFLEGRGFLVHRPTLKHPETRSFSPRGRSLPNRRLPCLGAPHPTASI